MITSVICPISGQSENEERFNTATHFFGLVLSLIGYIYLLMLSVKSENYLTIISSSVYGATLVLLYAASTYYHKAKIPAQKQTFKIIDHACIYLLIAGSYTPFTLGPLREYNGYHLMAIEWTIAIIGIALKIIAVDRLQIVSLFAYLGMGWLVVFSYETLMREISPESIFWLVAGGLSYTFGTVFYLWDRLPYNHGIWHLFVLGGSICHYICVLHLL